MHPSTLLTTVATLASVASAASNLGSWTVSDSLYSTGATGVFPTIKFNVKYSADSLVINCYTNYPDSTSSPRTCECSDTSLTCSYGASLEEINLKQDITLSTGRVSLAGKGTLDISPKYCSISPVSGSRSCKSPTIVIEPTSAAKLTARSYAA